MKKKYFSPTINVYNIVEAETILAGQVINQVLAYP